MNIRDVVTPPVSDGPYGKGWQDGQRHLVYWLEEEVVVFRGGILFASGPEASLKWKGLREALGLRDGFQRSGGDTW